MDFLDPKIEQYTLQHCEPESELLYELNRQTHLQILQPRMLSGHLQGRILSSYSKALSPNNVLEIGTYTGYSALCMAEGLKKNGTIASMSIGADRKFVFKHKISKEKVALILKNGSLLVMKDPTQDNWLHSLPTTKLVTKPRINLTFRTIIDN